MKLIVKPSSINNKNLISKKKKFLIINALIGIILIVSTTFIINNKESVFIPETEKAARIMEKSIQAIADYCSENNININSFNDPFSTGLIGPEMSEITTSIGHLEAKRSTINPNFAAIIVNMLMEANVKRGDTIAIACSGSFPSLLLASTSAAKAMGIHPRIILSLGSSSFGASNIDFNILDIFNILYENNIVDYKPIAISLGGEKDIGEEFNKNIIKKLIHKIQLAGIPFLYEQDLQKNVNKRNALYLTDSLLKIKAFINTGGAYANMGVSPLILNLRPGLIKSANIPEKSKHGMIFFMLEKKIPVIHLLFIKAITQEYNLNWDPAFIPEFKNSIYNNSKHLPPVVICLSIIYLLYFIYMLFQYRMLNNI
ncbi:poly-gamma-glutamate system protein [Bacteroidota bacterium]